MHSSNASFEIEGVKKGSLEEKRLKRQSSNRMFIPEYLRQDSFRSRKSSYTLNQEDI